MTNHEYATLMYEQGRRDGRAHIAPCHSNEPEYATGYAVGERESA